MQWHKDLQQHVRRPAISVELSLSSEEGATNHDQSTFFALPHSEWCHRCRAKRERLVPCQQHVFRPAPFRRVIIVERTCNNSCHDKSTCTALPSSSPASSSSQLRSSRESRPSPPGCLRNPKAYTPTMHSKLLRVTLPLKVSSACGLSRTSESGCVRPFNLQNLRQVFIISVSVSTFVFNRPEWRPQLHTRLDLVWWWPRILKPETELNTLKSNLRPETINPTTQTSNPRPETLNHKP